MNIKSASDAAHRAIDKVAGWAYQATERLGDKEHPLEDAKQQLADDYYQYVYDNPVKTTAMAVAAGFLLSRLLL